MSFHVPVISLGREYSLSIVFRWRIFTINSFCRSSFLPLFNPLLSTGTRLFWRKPCLSLASAIVACVNEFFHDPAPSQSTCTPLKRLSQSNRDKWLKFSENMGPPAEKTTTKKKKSRLFYHVPPPQCLMVIPRGKTCLSLSGCISFVSFQVPEKHITFGTEGWWSCLSVRAEIKCRPEARGTT